MALFNQILTKTDLVRAHGVSSTTVDNWLKRGMPHTKDKQDKYSFNLPETIKWRLEGGSAQNFDLTKERARLAKEQADKTEMENDERRGVIVDIEKISTVWTKLATNIKTRLLAISTKAAPLVLGCKTLSQVKEALDGPIYEALAELSSNPPGINVRTKVPKSAKSAAKTKSKRVGRPRKAT